MKKTCPYCGRPQAVVRATGKFKRHTYSDLQSVCQGSNKVAPK